MIFQSFDFERT